MAASVGSDARTARNKLFAAADYRNEAIRLGIGIVTYNRPGPLVRCLDHVLAHTKRQFELVVADDGSRQETADAVAPYIEKVNYIRFQNRGVNFNKNRLLFYFARVKVCDAIIIIEDDSFPIVDGWEENWIASISKWGHINNAGAWFADQFISGDGNADCPIRSPAVSAQCVGFSREAIEYVGFIDPAMENHGCGHAEHTYRMIRAGYGGEHTTDETGQGNTIFYLINGGVETGCEETGYPSGDHIGMQKYFELRDGPIYRDAWRNDHEQEKLWSELNSFVREKL